MDAQGRAMDAGQLRAHGQAPELLPEERTTTPLATAAQRGRFTALQSAVDIHLRRYTQLTQQLRGEWMAQDKDQLHRLKIFYADPQTPRGDLDPHRYLSNRVAKIFVHQSYEGTIITMKCKGL